MHYRDLWFEFLRAATTPSFPALLGIFSVASLIFLLCFVLISPRFIAQYGHYFMESPKDDYAYLTTKVLQLSQAKSSQLGIVLVGNSAVQEAVEVNVLLDKTAHSIPTYKLAAGGLFLLEAVCLLDVLQQNFHGIIVIQIGPSQLAFDKLTLKESITRHSRLAITCPNFDAEMQIAGLNPHTWSNHYFLDYYKFFVARLPAVLFNILTGPVAWDPHGSDDWLAPTPMQWESAIKKFGRWQDTYLKNRDDNLRIYKRLIRRLLEYNTMKVVLLETTVNPRAKAIIYQMPEKKALYEQYYTDVKHFAQEMGVPYWNLMNVVDLKAEDFIDHIHINSQKARGRYTAVLTDKLIDFLNK